MNDPLVHAQAKKFAKRVRTEADEDPARIHRAYLLLFGRHPSREETAAALEYLNDVADKLKEGTSEERTAKAWESLARALFLSNEFVYVD
jgi:hypothetical protein